MEEIKPPFEGDWLEHRPSSVSRTISKILALSIFRCKQTTLMAFQLDSPPQVDNFRLGPSIKKTKSVVVEKNQFENQYL